MPHQLRNLKINLSILTKKEEEKHRIKNQQHMNSDLMSSSSGTRAQTHKIKYKDTRKSNPENHK